MGQYIKAAPSHRRWDWNLYARWVGANAIAELIGLGGSAMVLVGLMRAIDTETPVGAVGVAVVSVILGTLLEGVLVGLLQWRVLRDPLPELKRADWVRGTAIGAAIAWILGMLPSTILSLAAGGGAGGPGAAAAPPAGPPDWLAYTLAASMGLVLGPILGTPQWVILRRHVQHAGWWIPANALAWMVGMPLVFVGAMNVPPGPITAWTVTVAVVPVLAAGAAVGAVHGIALLRLLRAPAPA